MLGTKMLHKMRLL